ncbi:MAG: tetratricopeptide repeat protein, partial [Phaeodactylibacter sp.]|nr:tetratricopeptide repeat protein [Phaeodactylibacter sp.]
GALYFVLKGLDKKQFLPFLWAGICFFLGLLSKENTITFIGVIPVAVYFFRKDFFKEKNWFLWAGLALVPLLIAAAGFIFMRGNALGWEPSETSFELMNNPFLKFEDNRYVELDLGEKSATITYTLGKYLQLLLVPYPLTHDYYPRHVAVMSWADWQVLLSLLLYLGLLVVSVWGLFSRKPIAFTTIYFLGTLSIVSNIVFPIGTNMAERFLYMPSLAYGMAVGILSHQLIRRKAPKGPFVEASLFRSMLIGLSLVALLYSALTVTRNFDWKDNYTLFTTDVAVSENSAKLQNSVAGELIGKADATKDLKQRSQLLLEAIEHAKKALEIHPYYKNPYLLMGNAYVYLEQYDQAIESYNTALKLDSEFADAINNRA